MIRRNTGFKEFLYLDKIVCLNIYSFFLQRVIQLLNGIKVLLISDHNTNKTKPGVLPLAKKDAEESDEEDEEEDEIEEEEGEEEEEEEESEMEDEDEDENENNKEKHGKKSGSNKSKEGERMAAASLCINVGSFSDPSDLPGLAHFLEHMVFMGSEKYTQENAFDEFLKVVYSTNIFKILITKSSLVFVDRCMAEVQMLQQIVSTQHLSLKCIKVASVKPSTYLHILWPLLFCDLRV